MFMVDLLVYVQYKEVRRVPEMMDGRASKLEKELSIMAQGEPNLYELTGAGGIQITYTPSDSNGKPDLVYVDATRNLSFNGDQVAIQSSPLGSLVTVFLLRTVDSGSTTLTVLVPGVNLATTASQPIKTVGIVTENLFSILELHTPRQTQVYSVIELEGSAQLI